VDIFSFDRTEGGGRIPCKYNLDAIDRRELGIFASIGVKVEPIVPSGNTVAIPEYLYSPPENFSSASIGNCFMQVGISDGFEFCSVINIVMDLSRTESSVDATKVIWRQDVL
jgi:hypothetical protein